MLRVARRRAAASLLPALLVAALAVGVAFAAVGDHVSSEDFDLAAANGNGSRDGVYCGTRQAKVYAYTSSGTSSEDFDLAAASGDGHHLGWGLSPCDGRGRRSMPTPLRVRTPQAKTSISPPPTPIPRASPGMGSTSAATKSMPTPLPVLSEDHLTSANGDGVGITWDGVYFRVTDGTDAKVYAYTSSGTYTSSEDFDLTSANDAGQGITWDGEYFRVADGVDDKVYAYDGRLLWRVVVDIGHGSGANDDQYGYDAGAFGTLDSGSFPGALFGDGNSRTVAEIYEDEDGYWFLTYSGGLANDWQDQEHLDEITVRVTYEDGVDSRSFVLGGFIDSRLGQRGLKLDPPLPNRDWDSRDGEDVIIDFQHRSQDVSPVTPRALTKPAGAEDSFVEFLSETTPGGPLMAQTLIVILVYVMFVFGAPSSPWGIILSAVVLIMTPWVPVLFGYGSTMAASIIMVNVLTGAYAYKVFAARTEA